MIHVGDITKLSGYDIPVVDVVTGGSPCQDLSVAGQRAGLGGERSGLFMEQIRIVKEMRERDRAAGRSGWMVRPRYMVWENVPGAFSSNGGEDFKTVLEEIVGIVEQTVPDLRTVVQGGVVKIRMRLRFIGKLVSCLARTRRTVLGSPPEKKTHRACRRFWRTQRSRNTL